MCLDYFPSLRPHQFYLFSQLDSLSPLFILTTSINIFVLHLFCFDKTLTELILLVGYLCHFLHFGRLLIWVQAGP
jgi:hypothetical protein